MTRATRRLTLVAATLALAPVIFAGPAYADTTPTPIASEPPGGATCAPGQPANGCGQDPGSTPTPTATTASPTATKAVASATGTSDPAVTSLPHTGSTTLAHTGGGTAAPWGVAGAGLLLLGTAFVVTAARRTELDPDN